MKKLMKVIFVMSFCLVGLNYVNASCDGNSYYIVTNWDDVAAEFSWN